jgi:hypothetical protein
MQQRIKPITTFVDSHTLPWIRQKDKLWDRVASDSPANKTPEAIIPATLIDVEIAVPFLRQ